MATATNVHDAQFLRTRKMATFLPVVGVPFLAVMFFLGGGGQGASATAQNTETGFNTNLPKAEKGTITSSKLEAYASPVVPRATGAWSMPASIRLRAQGFPMQ